MRTRLALAGSVVLAWAIARPAPASAQVQITGFAQANYAVRVTGVKYAGGTTSDFPLGEERLQLRLEAFSEDGSTGFFGRIDFFNDAVVNRPGIEIRETYLDLTSEYITLRTGRQIVTWGVGDLLFINDIFPKDWVAFFTGRPLQYLKVGSDAFKIGLHPGFLNAEIVVAPFFQPDRYPTGERLIVPDPFPSGLPRTVVTQERSIENMETSAKVSRYLSDWEVAAYVSRTFYRVPAAALDDAAAPTEVRFFFPRLNTYGGSVTGGLFGGVVSIEGAYYDSERDRDGIDPAIENSQVRGLIGYSRPLWEDAMLGIQGYAEWMQDHDAYLSNLPPGFAAQDELRSMATMRLTQLLFHQTLTFNLFVFGGISSPDGYLIPSLRYAFTDVLWGEVGGNIFLGEAGGTMFGRFGRNDNVYLTIRYGF